MIPDFQKHGDRRTRKKGRQMFYEMEIAGLKRQLPLCPINDELYIGAFIMFGDVEITVATAKALLEKAPEFDVLISAEAKGIMLCYEMARQSGKDYVIARKGPKLYMQNLISTEVDSITTAHIQKLCIGQTEIDMLRGKRVLIVDDVISTGESLLSMEALLNKVKGVEIVGRMAVLAEGEAADRDDIIFLEKLPLFNADGTPKE